MLNEPSILISGKTGTLSQTQPAESSRTPVHEQLETAVSAVMDVYRVDYNPPPPVSVSYTGRLRFDSEITYEQLTSSSRRWITTLF
jgi:hypothetical protein